MVSRQKIFLQNDFNPWIRVPGGSVWWKKWRQKISWYYPFKCMCSLSLFEWWVTYFSQLLLTPQFSVPRLHIYAILHDFNSSLLTFLKGPLNENLACFPWPINTDPCCSSHSFWYFQSEMLDYFTFYLRTCCTDALTCVFNPNPDGWGHIWLPKLWTGTTPQHLKSQIFLKLMYSSKTSW